jgi:hypothetical protein
MIGNKLADAAAKEATSLTPNPSTFIWLTTFRRLIHLQTLKEWEAAWKRSKRRQAASSDGSIGPHPRLNPSLSTRPSPSHARPHPPSPNCEPVPHISMPSTSNRVLLPPWPATLAELHRRPEHTSSWSARCGNLYRDLSTQQREMPASSVCSMSCRFSMNADCSGRLQHSLKRRAVSCEHLQPPMFPLSLSTSLKFFWFLPLAIHYIPLIIS